MKRMIEDGSVMLAQTQVHAALCEGLLFQCCRPHPRPLARDPHVGQMSELVHAICACIACKKIICDDATAKAACLLRSNASCADGASCSAFCARTSVTSTGGWKTAAQINFGGF